MVAMAFSSGKVWNPRLSEMAFSEFSLPVLLDL